MARVIEIAAIALLCVGLLFGCAQEASDQSVGADGSEDAQVEGVQNDDAQAQDDESNNEVVPAEQVEAPSASVSIEEAEAVTGISADEEGMGYMAGEVLVGFKSGTSLAEAEALFEDTPAVGDRVISEDMLVDGSIDGDSLQAGAAGDPVVLVRTAEGSTVVQAVAELQRSELVVNAEPNYVFELN